MRKLDFNPPQDIHAATDNVSRRLAPDVRDKFTRIIGAIRPAMAEFGAHFDTSSERKYLSIKFVAHKTIVNFWDVSRNLRIDIDTYPPAYDIDDYRHLFLFKSVHGKPNKTYMGSINSSTPDDDVQYFIDRIIEAIQFMSAAPDRSPYPSR